MKDENEEGGPRYRANPAVVAEVPDGVFVKRGSVELRITGPAVPEIVSTLLESLSEEPRTRAELLEAFPAVMRESVDPLITRLIERRILEPSDGEGMPPLGIESPAEIFYWENGVSTEALLDHAKARRFVVLGVNAVSRSLVESMLAGGLDQVQVVDVPSLRNVRFLGPDGELDGDESWPSSLPAPVTLERFALDDADCDCLVGTSDFGGMHAMREWNTLAVEASRAFYPVVLQNMRGYLGPLVVPGETACYECYRARQNSHMADPAGQRAGEALAHETQLGVSFHPAMASALGNLAALELTKFFVSRIAGWRVGTVVEVDLVKPELEARKVLRVPRCTVCDAGTRRATVSLDEKLFVPHQTRGE